MNILILGYGEMGHAMEHLLRSHHQIFIWDPYYSGDLADFNLHDTAARADAIVFCTPTAPLFELASDIGPHLGSGCVCLSMAKALDAEGRTAPQALQQGLPSSTGLTMMYGPMIAEEILADRPSYATVSATGEGALRTGMDLFHDTRLDLAPWPDMHGAALCAVLKNVYAMLFGMADELKLGDNVRGFLAVATLKEMADIMTSMGGESSTPYTLAGLGDLMTTATSEDSHHHELGRMAARGEQDLSGEGVNTLLTLEQKAILDFSQWPFLDLTRRIILHGETPVSALADSLKLA
ncbi:MAG: hypothetical protein DSZ33_02625 [Gammaproteobacteria bacterium]|nr:MAG: hypothetical protein DSZ33_02625 [Gammaproteobacteria bacterium]